MSFWTVHGYISGCFFILFLLILPRLTLLLSVSFWTILLHALVQDASLPYALAWPLTVVLYILAWASWVVYPRVLIAVFATLLYGDTNIMLMVGACSIGYLSVGLTNEIWKAAASAVKKKMAEQTAETESLRDAARRSAQDAAAALRRLNRAKQAHMHAEDFMRILREAQERQRAAEARARAAAHRHRSAKAWWEVLGVTKDATLGEIKAAYRKLAMKTHPDRGGDEERFKEVNAAYDDAKKMK